LTPAFLRTDAFTGTISAVIDNEFIPSGGPQLVSIASTDVGLHSDADCGTWTRIGAATAPLGIQNDIESQWLAHYQHRTGREPKPLIKQ
jgi:hypothetical protein